MRANASVLISGAVIVAVAAGCGGGTKTVSPDIWAPKVCSQVVKWDRSVKADATKITNLNLQLRKPGIYDTSALVEARNGYVTALAGMVTASTRFRATMAKLDPPDVKDGEEIQQAINDALTKLVPALKKAKRQLVSMRTDYPFSLSVRGNLNTGKTEIIYSPANPAFTKDVAKFLNPAIIAFDNISLPFRRAFKAPELKATVEKTPECPNMG
jgi:hypothetical protein